MLKHLSFAIAASTLVLATATSSPASPLSGGGSVRITVPVRVGNFGQAGQFAQNTSASERFEPMQKCKKDKGYGCGGSWPKPPEPPGPCGGPCKDE
jgi:hypothetical protein